MDDHETQDETNKSGNSKESPGIPSTDEKEDSILTPKDWIYFLQNEKNSVYGKITSAYYFILTLILSILIVATRIDVASLFEWIILGLILFLIILSFAIFLAKQFNLSDEIAKHSNYVKLIERIINKELRNSAEIKEEYYRIKKGESKESSNRTKS